MTQSWSDLLFAHWPIDLARLRAVVPAQLPVDTCDGRAWIGIVPFRMSNVSARGVPPLPWLSAFPELNVRTYVTLDGKPGVYFFSLDAANPVAVAVARRIPLPYYLASMKVDREGERIHYRSRRSGGGAELVGTYGPAGPSRRPEAGSLEYFLTERYCLYSVSRRGRVRRLEIDHGPWDLRPAEAEFSVNTMTSPLGLELPRAQPLLHFSLRQDAVAWLPSGPLDPAGER